MMIRRALPLTLLLILVACGGAKPSITAVPGHGAVSIEVIPNPIVATLVSGNTYDFPIEVVLRETGGRPITVQRVHATVLLGGSLPVARESWDADRIRSMGYGTTLAANSETRLRLRPRNDVPDERLFNSVSAELKVDAIDDTGTAVSAKIAVTIRR